MRSIDTPQVASGQARLAMMSTIASPWGERVVMPAIANGDASTTTATGTEAAAATPVAGSPTFTG